VRQLVRQLRIEQRDEKPEGGTDTRFGREGSLLSGEIQQIDGDNKLHQGLGRAGRPASADLPPQLPLDLVEAPHFGAVNFVLGDIPGMVRRDGLFIGASVGICRLD
jgi:hypothetical protein